MDRPVALDTLADATPDTAVGSLSATIGVALILVFVAHALRTDKPLIDLRLFRNRRLTIATVSMFVFIIAFMGAGLLFPSYFLQVRGETTLMAGLLIAPQGLGAMVTMPIAGVLADNAPVPAAA